MLKRFFKFLFIEIVYNGHLQSICAVALVIFSSMILSIKIDIWALLILYLSFYIIYLYNRFGERKQDGATNKTRTNHIQKISPFVPYILAVVSLAVVILLFLFGKLYFNIQVVVTIVFGVLYTTVFKDLTKKIPLFKNYYVALFFASLIIVPLSYTMTPFTGIEATILVMAVFVFLRGMRMQIFLDLKDLPSDRKQGLKTAGAIWGRRKVYKVLLFLSVLTTWIFAIFLFFTKNDSAQNLFFIFPLAFLFAFDRVNQKKIEQENFYGYLIESGEFILWPILLYPFYVI